MKYLIKHFGIRSKAVFTFSGNMVEKEIALKNVSPEEIINLLDTQILFELLDFPYPSTRESVIDRLITEKFIEKSSGKLNITNLGAILFAKDLSAFDTLSRKAPRVVIYSGTNKLETTKEISGKRGYAVGFERLINYIHDQLPTKEVIDSANETPRRKQRGIITLKRGLIGFACTIFYTLFPHPVLLHTGRSCFYLQTYSHY